MLEHLDNVVAQTTLTLTLLTALANLVLRALQSARPPVIEETDRKAPDCVIEANSSAAFCLEIHITGTSKSGCVIRDHVHANADDDPESATPKGLYPEAQGKRRCAR